MQKLREIESEQAISELSEKEGELITVMVRSVDGDNVHVEINKNVEAVLMPQDQAPGDKYQVGKPVKVYVNKIKVGPRGPQVLGSRTVPGFVKRLFEIEVPEIYDGVVEIKSIAREPGARSKVAVASRERNLDPVGACVGPKGSRVRMVVEELRNERVDVIQWNEDPAIYVANALSPAKVTKVVIDEENNYATVVVPDDQLSLAIGKEGQNARLAARLTGWHIDIKSASFAGAPLRNDNVLIDEDEVEDDEEGLCAFEDEAGNRCRNHARPGSRFCGIHAEMEDER